MARQVTREMADIFFSGFNTFKRILHDMLEMFTGYHSKGSMGELLLILWRKQALPLICFNGSVIGFMAPVKFISFIFDHLPETPCYNRWCIRNYSIRNLAVTIGK